MHLGFSANACLNTIEDEAKRADAFAVLARMRLPCWRGCVCRAGADAFAVLARMQRATGEPPAMWGSAIVGFGLRRMTSANGKEADWMCVGFSPRKQNLTLSLRGDWEQHGELLDGLGNYSCGKGCLYLKILKGIDQTVLETLVRASVERSPAQNE